jgi:ComEC/Rec2-related protein
MRPPVTYALLPLLVGLSLWDNDKDILMVLVILTTLLWCVGLVSIWKTRKKYAYKIGIGIIIGITLLNISKQGNYQETNRLYKKESNIKLYEMPPREIELSIKIKEQKKVRGFNNIVRSIYSGVIIDVPKIRKDLMGKEIIIFSNAKVNAFLCEDIVQCFGVIRILKNRDDNLISSSERYQINVTDIVMITESDKILSNIKRKIHLGFTKGKWYNHETGGFVYAILMGNKSLLSPKQSNLFMKTGTMHLFAVSGLHVGIVYLLISVILNRLSTKRVIWISITLLLVFCYVALVSFSPSACRAYTMISLWQIGVLLNKKRNPLSCLYLTAVILLTINPNYLVSVGFQLSFTVVLNIIFIMRQNTNRKDLSVLRIIWSTFIISYASFFGSLLLVIDNFHFANPISIVINAILVNTIVFVFIILLIQVTLTIIFGNNIFIKVIEIIYNFIDIILNWFYEISFFQIHFSKTLDIPNAYHLFYPIVLICIIPYTEKVWQKLVVLSFLPISFILVS